MLIGTATVSANYPWEDVLKSVGRSKPTGKKSDQLADSVAGQNILVDLRISELLDTAAKLVDRAFRNPAAMAEEGAQLAQTLQQIANGNSTWTPQRNDKRFNDPAWTENTFYKGMLQGYMAWSQSLQNFAEKAGFEAKEAGRAKFLLSRSASAAPTNFYSATLRQSRRPSTARADPSLDGYQNLLEDAVAEATGSIAVDFRSLRSAGKSRGDARRRRDATRDVRTSSQYAPNGAGLPSSDPSSCPLSSQVLRVRSRHLAQPVRISQERVHPVIHGHFGIRGPSTTIGEWKPISRRSCTAFRAVQRSAASRTPHDRCFAELRRSSSVWRILRRAGPAQYRLDDAVRGAPDTFWYD